MEVSKKTHIKFNILAIVLIIVFAFAVSPKTLQNDTFYTIKIGEYIMQNGITMQDPFSWHTLSYSFPHWAYDVMIYLIYNLGGHLGVYISTIVFAAILGIVMYFMNSKLTKNKPISFVLTIAALFLLKDFIAARAQLVTFILFALEVLWIECFLETGKKRYIFGLIIIPMLIANLHVAVFPFYFILYLPYIAEYIISILTDFERHHTRAIEKLNKKLEKTTKEDKIEKIQKGIEKNQKAIEAIRKHKGKEPYKLCVKKRETTRILIIVMIICLFTGLFTPLGNEPYTYLIKTMKGDSTQSISEHLPLTLAENENFAAVLIAFLAILIFTDTKIRLCDLFMLGGLTFLAFMTRRQESIFIILCIPIFNRLVTSFLNKYEKDGINEMTKIMTGFIGIVITTTLVIVVGLGLYGNRYKSDYVSKSSYPVDAAKWIKENLNVNEIKLYNEYNYGSYLLFEDIPVFIDSRADLYLPEFNKGVRVFEDFINISSLNLRKLEIKFDHYGFTHLITGVNSRLTIYLDAKPDIYKEIYHDDYFRIYERNKVGE